MIVCNACTTAEREDGGGAFYICIQAQRCVAYCYASAIELSTTTLDASLSLYIAKPMAAAAVNTPYITFIQSQLTKLTVQRVARENALLYIKESLYSI